MNKTEQTRSTAISSKNGLIHARMECAERGTPTKEVTCTGKDCPCTAVLTLLGIRRCDQ